VYVVKDRFGKSVELNLLIKDYETGTEDLKLNVQASELDRIADDRYSKESLESILV